VRAEHTSGVFIAAPVEQVWDVVVAWERQHEWIPLTRVWRTGGTPGEPGETVTARTGIGRLAFDDTIVVEAVDRPWRCRVQHTGRVVHGVGEFRLIEVPEGTRLLWWEQVRVPGGPVAPLLWRLASPVVSVSFALALRRLARLVERG
jgi:carbon monoxide dehydrogenase subunit G